MSSQATATHPGNTKTIARNSLWYGFELSFTIVTAFATSIPMARMIGPEKLGYFNYIAWLTNISAIIGGLGMAGATRKYMAEYLGRGQAEVARAVFIVLLKLQVLAASIVTIVCLVLVFTVSNPAYHWISAFLVLSILPSMITSIPSQANVAAENMRANAGGSLVAYLIHIAFVAISLALKWDLKGIAVGVFTFRAVDCLWKLWFAWGRLRLVPKVPLPQTLRKKLINFSSYSLILFLLNLLVMDRSDVIFLKAFSTSIAEITFFTVAFNLTEKLQLLPLAIGTAMGASIQAQYGRDPSRLPQITSSALWYTFVCGLPLMAGMAALSGHIIPLLYGKQFAPAIPVLAIAATFAIPKCMSPAWNLLEALEDQRFLAIWLGCCGAVNIVLDITLIPAYGAKGAAIANGVAQLLAALGVIARAKALSKFQIRLSSAIKAVAGAGAMVAAVLWISHLGSAWALVPVAVVCGAIIFFLAARFTSAFDSVDRERLLLLRSVFPVPLRKTFAWTVCFLIPAESRQGAR